MASVPLTAQKISHRLPRKLRTNDFTLEFSEAMPEPVRFRYDTFRKALSDHLAELR